MEQKEHRENGRPSASEMTCYDVGAKMVQAVDVAVVGGSWSGIGCAVALTQRGLTSALLERGPGFGGRGGATRRVKQPVEVSFDHGCPWFDTSLAKRMRTAGLPIDSLTHWEPLIHDIHVDHSGDVVSHSESSNAYFVSCPPASAVSSCAVKHLQQIGLLGSFHSVDVENAFFRSIDSCWDISARQRGPDGQRFALDARALAVCASSRSSSRMLANVAPDLSSRAARTEADAHWCIMSAMSNTDAADFPPFDCAHVSSDDGSFPLDWISVDSRNPSRDSNPAHFVGLASPHCSNNRKKADNSKLLSEVKPALLYLIGHAESSATYSEAFQWTGAQPKTPTSAGG